MVREISLYSNNSTLISVHPLEKIVLTVISLVVGNYITNKYLLILNIIFLIALNVAVKNPMKIVIKFILIVLFFGVFTSISLLWQGYDYNNILIVILRGINGALSISFLALTTPINHIVYLFSKWEWTRDIGDIMKSMERFIILIEDDFSVTFNAIKSRCGFNGCKGSIEDFGRGCGLVFNSLIRRWKEINMSMKNRCYIGKHNYNYKFNKSHLRQGLIVLYCGVLFIGVYFL